MREPKTLTEKDLDVLRNAIHDLNNSIGVILATSELLEIDVSGRARDRCRRISEKAVEAREVLLRLSSRYFR